MRAGVGVVMGVGLLTCLASAGRAQTLVELPRETEIALALSALPEHLRDGATVHVLEDGVGFVRAIEGSNGFHALVSRVEPAAFRADWPYEAHVPDVLLPISFDAAGVDGPMQPFLDAGALLARGTAPADLKRLMRSSFDDGRYKPAARTGVSYMLAPVMRAYPTPLRDDRVFTLNAPHRMFYAPYVTNQDVGGEGAGGGQAYIIQEGVHGYIGQRAGPAEVASINQEHAELIRSLCALHAAWCLPDSVRSTAAGAVGEEASDPSVAAAGAREVALSMPRAIDYADWDTFSSIFTADAMMYFPFRAERAEGFEAIASVMRPIFERNVQRGEGPFFGFAPEDVAVRMLGTEGAVVTWIMRNDGRVSRRTASLVRTEDGWRIWLVHADNWTS